MKLLRLLSASLALVTALPAASALASGEAAPVAFDGPPCWPHPVDLVCHVYHTTNDWARSLLRCVLENRCGDASAGLVLA